MSRKNDPVVAGWGQVLSEYERLIIGQRTRAALAAKKARGLALGGDAPFGYRKVDGRLVPIQKEQAVIEHARKLRGKGHTLNEVAELLAARGFAPRKGGTFHPQQIARMVKEPNERASVAAARVARSKIACKGGKSPYCHFCRVRLSPALAHEHDHFPIPHAAGGTETVCACINCHDIKDRIRADESFLLSQAWDEATPAVRIFIAKLFRVLLTHEADCPTLKGKRNGKAKEKD